MDPIDKVNSLSSTQKVAIQKNETPPPSTKDIQKQVQAFQGKINELNQAIRENLKIDNFKLNFSIDSETKTVVVKILDADTGKVIQEIPPAEILAIAKELEKLKGILFNENI